MPSAHISLPVRCAEQSKAERQLHPPQKVRADAGGAASERHVSTRGSGQVRVEELLPGGLARRPPAAARSGACATAAVLRGEAGRVDHGHDRVHAHRGSEARQAQRLQHRLRVSQTCRLEQEVVKVLAVLEQLLEGIAQAIVDRTADAAVGELRYARVNRIVGDEQR
eukprot:scaffold115596_cov36-Phaeocystis_antarctica.AAC.2